VHFNNPKWVLVYFRRILPGTLFGIFLLSFGTK
jgi:hypothetical protein